MQLFKQKSENRMQCAVENEHRNVIHHNAICVEYYKQHFWFHELQTAAAVLSIHCVATSAWAHLLYFLLVDNNYFEIVAC